MRPSPRANTARTVHGTDLYERTLGVGTPNGADKAVGKANARWARVDLSDGGATAIGATKEYDVAHDLGATPTVVTLETYERASGPVTIAARGVRQENWSHSHAHLLVTLLAGSLDGCVAVVKVQGR